MAAVSVENIKNDDIYRRLILFFVCAEDSTENFFCCIFNITQFS